MKICLVTFEYPPQIGGVAHSVKRIANALFKRGIEIHIVVVSLNSTNSFSKFEGHYVHRFGPFNGDLKYISEGEAENLKSYLIELDKKYDFDLFHAFTIFPCGYITVKVSKHLGKPVIVSGRGGDGIKDLSGTNIREKKWTIRNADFLTFVSSEMKDYVNNFEKCRGKSKVILNSVDNSEFYYIPKMKKPKLKGFVIGIATTIRETKGFEYLLKAFAKFSKEYESTLLLAGDFRTKEIKEKYITLINELDISDKVIITGLIKHKFILNYIDVMEVYVLPSIFSEGCPNSLLEAMYLGKPVIGSKIGAIPEIIKHKKNGILVTPKDADEIYESLVLLKKDEALRRFIGQDARATIREKFNLDNESQQWYASYRDVLFKTKSLKENILCPDYQFKFVMVEPTNRCNLNCPLCPTGNGEIKPKKDMPLKEFKKIIDQLPNGKSDICLWNFGEPLLHKDIFAMINYAAMKGHRTFLSSNASFLNKEIIENLLSSQLYSITVCLDGATEETYKVYRKKGDFQHTISNIKNLCSMKREKMLKLPIIELQFIVMKHNEHEIQKIQKLAEHLGVDNLAFKTVSCSPKKEKEFLPILKQFRRNQDQNDTTYFCDRAWTSLVINCDGKVMPCCYAHHKEEYVLGNAFTSNLKEIWESKRYKAFRRRHLLNKQGIDICKNCNGHMTNLYAKKTICKKNA